MLPKGSRKTLSWKGSGSRALEGRPRRTMGERMEKREERGKEQHKKKGYRDGAGTSFGFA